MEFKTLQVSELKPHELNAKLYNDRASDIKKLAKSISKHGLLEPVVVSSDGEIISGHRRISALQLLGMPTVKARVLPPLAADELAERLIEHNRYRVKSATELVSEILQLQRILNKRKGERSDLLTSVKLDAGQRREDTRTKISKKTGVSTGNISKLLFVQRIKPELLKSVDSGVISTNQAYLHAKRLERERNYEEIKKEKPSTRDEGESWQVVLGDSRLVSIEKESVQTVICSPPWWSLRDYKTDEAIGCEKTEEEFLDQLFDVFTNIKPAIKQNGCLFIEFGDAAFGNAYSGTTEKLCLGLIERGWFLRERIALVRQSATGFRKKTWAPAWSIMFFFSKSEEYKFDPEKIRRPHAGKQPPRIHIYHRLGGEVGTPTFPSENGKRASNVIEVQNEKWRVKLEKLIGSQIHHPAVYSRDVVVEPILATTDEGDLVLDPFSGTATTGVAAIQLGRKYLGVEVNPVFAETSKLRLQAEEDELKKGVDTRD